MHVAITGASSGIGEGLVREFAAAGANITMVARRTELLTKIASEIPTRSHIATADLSRLEACTDWLSGAEDALGPIDILINNAGVQIVGLFHDNDHEWGSTLLHLNLLSPLRIASAVLPAMLERGQGTIVNIASLAALAPVPGMVYYNASKAGLAAASESLRAEVQERGVHILTVYPGPVTTPMADAAKEVYVAAGHGKHANTMPTGDVATLAKQIHKAVQKKSPRVIYPRVYEMARAFPSTARWLIDRFAPTPES